MIGLYKFLLWGIYGIETINRSWDLNKARNSYYTMSIQIAQLSKTILREVLLDTRIISFLERLREHHEETHQHSIRVAYDTIGIFLTIKEGEISDEVREEAISLGYCGILHDAGKLRIPKAILSKKEALDEEEWEIMKQHPRYGFEELRTFDHPLAKYIAVGHHEYQQRAYPRRNIHERNVEERIASAAQIVCVADIADALTHKRSYKPALPKEEAYRIMRTQYTGDHAYLDSLARKAA